MRMDFLRLPYNEKEYPEGFIGVLAMKDDATHFVHLVPVKAETSYLVAKALIEWSTHSRMPLLLCVDRGTHFINQVIDELKRYTGIATLLPTIANNKQTHGSAEILNREVRKILTAICSERQISTYEWYKVLPIVVHSINHTPAKSLGGYSPVQLFTGQAPESSLAVHLDDDRDLEKVINFKKLPIDWDKQVQDLVASVNNWNRQAVNASEKIREASRKSVNKNRLKREFRFEIGQYVLRAIGDNTSAGRKRTKIQTRWIGPLQIIGTRGSKTYVCKDLLTGVGYELHADEMHLYATPDLKISRRLQEQMAFDATSLKAQGIIEYSVIGGRHMVKVKWKGINKKGLEVWHDINAALRWFKPQRLAEALIRLKKEDAEKLAHKILDKMI